MNSFDNYRSPFSWRYGSPELRRIWSEQHKRRLWRQLWVALAEIQNQFGIISDAQLHDLRAHKNQVDIQRALEIEQEIRHDVMAELRAFAEQCPLGGGVIHLGMTSMDVVDNADALRVKTSLQIIVNDLRALIQLLGEKVIATAEWPVMGYTHLQPAEPTTIGYRLSQYLQDLYSSYQDLNRLMDDYRGKGLKGAVGTRAAFREIFGEADLERIENIFSSKINLEFFPITNQTYPRLQDYRVLSSLAGTAAVLNKMAFDVRILQIPAIGEWFEPRRETQVGSSAMPFKHNPVQSENVNALAKLIAQFPRVAWDDTAFNLLERTLDDSANRRTILPESILMISEMIFTIKNIFNGLIIDEIASRRNLETYAVFAAQEPLLMVLTRAGANRQDMHEKLRQIADQAWQEIRKGSRNPLAEYIIQDVEIGKYVNRSEIEEIISAAKAHVGDAALMAEKYAREVLAELPDETR